MDEVQNIIKEWISSTGKGDERLVVEGLLMLSKTLEGEKREECISLMKDIVNGYKYIKELEYKSWW